MADETEGQVPDGAAVFPDIPAELGVHPLLLAVLHAVVFLQGSEAAVVNPAAADEAVEYLAGYVQRLSGAELRRAEEDMATLIGFAKSDGWSKGDVLFLKEFLKAFGAGAGEGEGE